MGDEADTDDDNMIIDDDIWQPVHDADDDEQEPIDWEP